MTKKKQVPQVRLSGFCDEWIITKLGNISDRVTRKNSNLESTLPLTISAQYGLVDQVSFFNNQVASQNISNYYLLLKGEFAYNKSTSQDYPVGAVKRLDRYDMGVLSTLYILFNPNEAISSDYLVSYFDSSCWHNEIKLRAAEGARNHGLLNIGADDFFDIDICLPTDFEEQQSIGSLIQKIDMFISEKRTKFDKLQTIRDSMLVKMFPRDGALTPEVRFSAFSGEWESRAMSSLFQEYSEKNHSELPVLTIIQGKGTISREHSSRYMNYDTSTVSNYKLVREGDFIVHLRSFEGGLEKANSDGIVSPAYHTLHGDNVDTSFYYLYFRSFDFIHNKLKNCVYGIRDGRSIDIAEMMKIEIPYTSIEEQQAIGKYFSKLDELISLTRFELEKLQQIKKALLSKLFV